MPETTNITISINVTIKKMPRKKVYRITQPRKTGWDIVNAVAKANGLSAKEFCGEFQLNVYEKCVEIPFDCRRVVEISKVFD